MNDARFISILNSLAKERRIKLPVLRGDERPASSAVAIWADFLENCVKRGVSLSDTRWQRVSIKEVAGCTAFVLEGGCDPPPDPDFRVGLQLLMGLMGQYRVKE